MRAYGLPRKSALKYHDAFTVAEFGLPGRAGNRPSRSGEYRSQFYSAEGKARTRRVWKRHERQTARREISVERSAE